MEHQQQHQGGGVGAGGGMPQGYPASAAVAAQQAAMQQAAATGGVGPYQQVLQQQQQQLQMFWAFQMQEIEQVADFKNHQLPLARIKKIMKADEDVRMISAEAPVLFAKACEMFILELTLRSWIHAEENKRRTLQKNDIAAAITRTDIFDFLVDIVPRDDPNAKDADARAALPEAAYYYAPVNMNMNTNTNMNMNMQGQPPSIMMGRPAAMQMDPSLYMHQPRPYAMPPHQVWQQQMPDGQAYTLPHHHQQQQHNMPDGHSYVQQQMPDGHSYGTPPPPAD